MPIRNSRIRTLTAAATVALALFAWAPATAASWDVNAEHSHVGFSVKHFFTPVQGDFTEFEVELFYDAGDPDASTVEVTIPVSSISTGNSSRDGHLVTPDFFDAATYPNITFKSTSVRSEGDQLIATGDLTIKGVTREIELPITVAGVQEVPEQMRQMLGATRVAGFEASTTIDRGDFGVGTGSWAATVMVGGEVTINLSIQARN